MNQILFQMTPAEAAKELDISVELLRMYLRKGIFKRSFKSAGTRWIIDRQDVEDFKQGKIEVKGAFRKGH